MRDFGEITTTHNVHNRFFFVRSLESCGKWSGQLKCKAYRSPLTLRDLKPLACLKKVHGERTLCGVTAPGEEGSITVVSTAPDYGVPSARIHLNFFEFTRERQNQKSGVVTKDF
ncbi:hypothetical protein CRENBAI_021134 [Crenichthys baileyi]|uniref:Uncharacterized protein n=1 Tax=Crenichthys baileyi TaxID=28760 RepID=A0AAV9RBR7_9TELE